MNDPRLRKWQFGLGVLGVVTLCLLGFVVVQGVNGKQDRQVFKQATEIADKLNNYVDSRQQLPESLSDAGVSDVPGAITYTKKSSDTYEFCVTWHASNADVSSQVAQDLSKATTDQGYSQGSAITPQDYTPAYLYVDPNHKAGRQCQTVKAYIFSDSNFKNFDGAMPLTTPTLPVSQ